MEQESDGDNNCNWCVQDSHKMVDKGTEGRGNKWKSGNHPNYSINIGQNTGVIPGYLRKLAVSYNPGRNH